MLAFIMGKNDKENKTSKGKKWKENKWTKVPILRNLRVRIGGGTGTGRRHREVTTKRKAKIIKW